MAVEEKHLTGRVAKILDFWIELVSKFELVLVLVLVLS